MSNLTFSTHVLIGRLLFAARRAVQHTLNNSLKSQKQEKQMTNEDIIYLIIVLSPLIVGLIILLRIDHISEHGVYHKPQLTRKYTKPFEEYFSGSSWTLRIIEYPEGIMIQIGCQKNTIEFWDDFFSKDYCKHLNRRYDTPRDTVKFKRIRKDYLYVRKQAIKNFKIK